MDTRQTEMGSACPKSVDTLIGHIGDPRVLAEDLDMFETLVLALESQRSDLLLNAS